MVPSLVPRLRGEQLVLAVRALMCPRARGGRCGCQARAARRRRRGDAARLACAAARAAAWRADNSGPASLAAALLEGGGSPLALPPLPAGSPQLAPPSA